MSAPSFTLGARAGASLAVVRLRSRGFALACVLALALTGVAAFVERRVGMAGAVDRTLGVVAGWIVPIFCTGALSLLLAGRGLRESTWPAARFGAPRAAVALGSILVLAIATAAVALLLAMLGVALAHGDGAPPLLGDLLTSAWVAALGGAAYAAWLSFGASFGRVGGGRYVVLVLDFVLGGTDLLGVVLPRGNLENLLGLGAPFDVGQRASSLLLSSLAVLVAAVASWRSRD
jgi:hypothetical protein